MTIPDYKRAFQAIQMFKDEYLLDYINVEQLGERDEDIDERVIENEIVHNVKNFIMTFGRGFSYMGNQVHYDKLGHDHWVDLLFFNRILKSLVVIELKKGSFKPAYLGQLAAYLRVLDDEERIEGENPSVGMPTGPMSNMSCRITQSQWVLRHINPARNDLGNSCRMKRKSRNCCSLTNV